MNKTFKYIRAIAFLFLIVVIGSLVWRMLKLPWQNLLYFEPESPVFAAVVLLGIYCLKTIIWLIPLTLLFISAGFMFQPIWAIPITYFCLLVEISLGFFFGKYLGNHNIKTILGKNKYSKRIFEFGNKNSIMGCFLVQLFPGPPADVINMFLGAMDMDYSKFVFGTLLGLTPKMIPLVLMGEAATDPLSPEFLVPFSFSVVFTLCTLMIYYHRKKRTSERTFPKERSLRKRISKKN